MMRYFFVLLKTVTREEVVGSIDPTISIFQVSIELGQMGLPLCCSSVVLINSLGFVQSTSSF